PKNVFVKLNTLKLGVLDAVLSFNDVFASKLDIYKELGLTLSKNSVLALRGFDVLRLKKADRAAQLMTNEARTAGKKRRLVLEEDQEHADGPAYGAVMF
ncbi:hypothetical protein J6590_090999, partial [Homalodisca vitripennis]